MSSFYSNAELKELGLASFGNNVLISRKVSIYGAGSISIGSNVRIDDFCILSGRIQIGNYVHIAAYTALFAGTVGIFIDDFSGFSSKIVIYAVSDDYTGETMSNPMIPEKFKKVTHKPVEVHRHVLVGASCVILPGAILSEGSSFGAMTLIDRASEPWSINAGIPFRKIKNRSHKLLEIEKQFIEEEDE